MSDIDRIEQRLSAVERAVVDGDVELNELADIASVASAHEELAARFEEHERRIAALEGRIDALDGVVGNVESVNEAVERRADVAVAAVDRLEYRLDELERAVDDATDLDTGGPKAPPDGIASGDRTGAAGTNGSASDRDERDSPEPSSEPVDATEPVSDPPAVERTVSEIVSPATDGDGESSHEDGEQSAGDDESNGNQPDLHSDDPPNRGASTARKSRANASPTQAALDSRLSESADRDGGADGDGSDGRTSRGSDTYEPPSDGDDGSAEGVLQSLRSRLP